jgi:hypothetical protein
MGLQKFRALLVFTALIIVSAQASAGTIGRDGRIPIDAYAKRQGMQPLEARKLLAANGRIMCPFNAATAFLVHRNDIVMTARHTVIPEPSQNAYAAVGRPNRCGFEISVDGKTSAWYDVDVASITWPQERQRSFTDRFDWIIMKLSSPVHGVTPYRLADLPARDGDKVELVSLRQDKSPYQDWNERIVESCRVRRVLTIDKQSGSGLKTDCSAFSGASGGPILRRSATGLEVLGVQSSGSPSCRKYNERTCASWAVGISDEVKRAIRKLAASE